jgi:Iron hydrogenase small subunit
LSQAVAKRQAALYSVDERAVLRRSHDNPDVQRLYRVYLGQPLSQEAHRLLHTHYVAGGPDAAVGGPVPDNDGNGERASGSGHADVEAGAMRAVEAPHACDVQDWHLCAACEEIGREEAGGLPADDNYCDFCGDCFAIKPTG